MQKQIDKEILPLLNNKYNLEFIQKDNLYLLKIISKSNDELDIFKRYKFYDKKQIEIEVQYVLLPNSDLLNKIFDKFYNIVINNIK